MLRAEAIGREGKEIIIKKRLQQKLKFFDPIKKLKLKTMAITAKSVKVKSSANKVIELKQQGNIAFQLLLRSQDVNAPMNLEKVMTYQLTPIPYCLGTTDGFFY